MPRGMKHLIVTALRHAPLSVAAPVVRRRVRRMQDDPAAMAVARRQMEFLLGVTQPGLDLDMVARRHLERMVWRGELRWRPELITSQPVTGIEHLSESRGAHGGLVLAFMHHGHFDGAFASLVKAGAPTLTTVGHPLLFDADAPPHLRQHMALVRSGSSPVDVSMGYSGLRDLVLAGHTLTIAVDQPGSTPITFAGRSLLGTSGAARIAFETKSPLVLLTAHPGAGLTPRLELSEPLLPWQFDTVEDLLAAMLAGFAPSIQAWPEAADWPRAKWTHLDLDGNPLPVVREPGQPEV